MWGKSQRPIVVVFGKLRTLNEGKQLTPYAEFTADDHGTFAGVIPNPARPREGLSERTCFLHVLSLLLSKVMMNCLPQSSKVRRLRLVVQPDDEIVMVEHGLWVASLRNRF